MKKKIIIITCLVLLYFIVSFTISFIEGRKKIVYIGYYTQVHIKDDGFKVINNNQTINNKKIKLFIDNKFHNGYMNSKDASIYIAYNFYDEDYKKIQIEDKFIATTKNLNISIKNVEAEDTTANLEEILDYNNIDYIDVNKNKSKEYTFDIDQDGKKETIYKIMANESEKINKTYYIMNSEDDYYVITSYENDNEAAFMKTVDLFKFIDFDSDGVYEMVFGVNNGGDIPAKYKIYSYKEGKFIK